MAAKSTTLSADNLSNDLSANPLLRNFNYCKYIKSVNIEWSQHGYDDYCQLFFLLGDFLKPLGGNVGHNIAHGKCIIFIIENYNYVLKERFNQRPTCDPLDYITTCVKLFPTTTVDVLDRWYNMWLSDPVC